jgi:uncharacterized protein
MKNRLFKGTNTIDRQGLNEFFMITKCFKNKRCLVIILSGLSAVLMISCNDKLEKIKPQEEVAPKVNTMKKSYNPVVYFEIPVTNVDRAIKFYSAVFNFKFEKETIDKNEMALFPFTENDLGISGALAKGEIYKPSKNGTLIYFRTENIDDTLKLAVQNGGKILYPKTSNGDLGFVAEFEDSEGNRIALHQSIKQKQ